MSRNSDEDIEALLPKLANEGSRSAMSRSGNGNGNSSNSGRHQLRAVTLGRNVAIAMLCIVFIVFVSNKHSPASFDAIRSHFNPAPNATIIDLLDDMPGSAASLTAIVDEEPYVEPEPVVVEMPVSPFNMSKAAILLENRDLPELVTMLHDFIVKVPQDWPFHIFVGEANEDKIRANRLLRPHLESGKLTLTRLPDESLIHGQAALSQFLASPWLWENTAPAEHLFFFQADSVICSRAEKVLDDWLGFDQVPGGYAWVGAPWAFAPGRRIGGNGGFSLRRRSIMLNVTQSYDYEPGVPEDLWFARILERDFNPMLPTFHKALTFSFENPPAEVWNSDLTFHTYGVHVGHYWSQCPYPQNVKRLLEYCPDAKLIVAPECLPVG